jgi:hypothetical protein
MSGSSSVHPSVVNRMTLYVVFSGCGVVMFLCVKKSSLSPLVTVSIISHFK